jgi:hypothetical protein
MLSESEALVEGIYAIFSQSAKLHRFVASLRMTNGNNLWVDSTCKN